MTQPPVVIDLHQGQYIGEIHGRRAGFYLSPPSRYSRYSPLTDAWKEWNKNTEPSFDYSSKIIDSLSKTKSTIRGLP